MHHDRTDRDDVARREAAIHDAVLNEDPSDWGRDRTMSAGEHHDASVRDAPSAGWGHPTVPQRPLGERADTLPTTPVAGDAAAATYVPPRSTTVASRERVVAPLADAEPPVDRPRFSIGATFLGWAVAAFFTVIFSAVALTFAGGNEALDGTLDLGSLAITSLIGYLIASFFAYLIGGYAAGRISLWHGTWHGLGTVAWAVLFAVLGVLAGVYLADTFNFGLRIDLAGLGGAAIFAVVASLVAMLAGAALGGRLGERYHEGRHAARTREVRGHRGRPL